MRFHPTPSSAPASWTRQQGGIGLFQMLGLGLLLMTLLFVLIVVVRSFFSAA
jgi:hypothetical protein